MKNGKFIEHYAVQLTIFHLFFEKTMLNQEMEDIHQLRVSIKKLRATWSLIQMVNHGKWKKKVLAGLVRDLFQVAGQLREAQINLTIAERFPKAHLGAYAKYLKKCQRRSNKKLIKRMQRFDIQTFNELNDQFLQMMRQMPDDFILKESAAFVFKKTRKILAIKDQLPDEEKLHDIRIHQKAVQEVLSIINVLSTDGALDHFRSQIKSLNDRIGKWHDYHVLLLSLKKFSKKQKDKKRKKQLKKFIKRINKKQKASQEKIHKLLDQYVAHQRVKRLENLL